MPLSKVVSNSLSLTTLTASGAGSIQGLTVGRGAGAVSTNTAVGASALAANTTGNFNSAFGNSSLNANTTGQYNVGIGPDSLRFNTTASNNTAVGYQAGYASNSGNGVSALGYQAMYSNTSGDATAMGYQALYANTTGTANAAFGYRTLDSNTTGSYNAAFGADALAANTTASRNTAVGFSSATANTTGTRNTGVGAYSLYVATTGNFNTAIGDVALESLTTGSNNTAIGIGSGGAITTGSKNTIIGGYTGNQGGLDIRTASNHIVLSDGDGNPRGVFDNQGAFYVGKSTGSATDDGWQIGQDGKGGAAFTQVGVNEIFVWNNIVTNGTAIVDFRTNSISKGRINWDNTNTSYNTTSDYRLKENVQAMTGALGKVAALKPCTYTWKDGRKSGQGFIAHELGEVVPECVTGEKDAVDENGNIKPQGIDTSFLVATLTAAIQEQQALITQLQADVAALKGQP